MELEKKSKVLNALRAILEPMVSFLLDAGVGFREFSQIAKEQFVKSASENYGVRGRPTNASRIAVMTGLSRKEIRTIREASSYESSEQGQDLQSLNPASVVLHAWFSDREYLDSDGLPLRLPQTGQSQSFSDLCRTYAGDVPYGAVLSELKRVGCVLEGVDGLLLATQRYFMPLDFDEKFIGSMAFSYRNLGKTLIRNARYSANKDLQGLQKYGLLERYVWTSSLSSSDKEDFKEYAERRAEAFLADLDSWIGNREKFVDSAVRDSAEQGDANASRYIGLGVYLFEDDDSPDV